MTPNQTDTGAVAGVAETDICDCVPNEADPQPCRCEKSSNPFWRGYAAGLKAPRHAPGQPVPGVCDQTSGEALDAFAKALYDFEPDGLRWDCLSDTRVEHFRKMARFAFRHSHIEVHKTMTLQEYLAEPRLNGWHSVCFNVDGFGGFGVRYYGEPLGQVIANQANLPHSQPETDLLGRETVREAVISRADRFFNTATGEREWASDILRDMTNYLRALQPSKGEDK